jgi:hypothetical protein
MTGRRLLVVAIALRKAAFETIGEGLEGEAPPKFVVKCGIRNRLLVTAFGIMLWMEPVVMRGADKVIWAAPLQLSHILVQKRGALQPLLETIPYFVSPVHP